MEIKKTKDNPYQEKCPDCEKEGEGVEFNGFGCCNDCVTPEMIEGVRFEQITDIVVGSIASETRKLNSLKENMKSSEVGKEKSSLKFVRDRIKELQNRRNKLNREITSLKKIHFKQ